MEELLALLLQILWDLVLQVIFEIVADLAWAVVKTAFLRPERSTGVAVVVLLALGGAAGWVSLLVWPERILHPTGGVRGFSLILSPLLAGLAMQTWGECRRSRGHVTTKIATFPGGAAFAFGMAFARLMGVR